MRKFVVLCFIAATPLVSGCDTIDSHTARNAQEQLVGMSRADYYTCSGLPNRTQMVKGVDYETWDFQPYTPDNSLSATLPLVGGISLGAGGTCHATVVFADDKVSAITYAGDTGGVLGHVAECVSLVNHCLNDMKPATGKY